MNEQTPYTEEKKDFKASIETRPESQAFTQASGGEDRVCRTCKHWQETEEMRPYAVGARCDEIKPMIDAELKTGWEGGYVLYYETNADFGCVKHENP